jgi:cysteinyl-tRNA synthetase
MELQLYDTLTRKKRPFQPIDPARVRMYVCGPTVYDFAHIGNARPVIVFDVLFRLLRHLAKQGIWDGGRGKTEVVYVRNITDVDDKINARAAEEYPGLPLNEAIRKVTEKTDQQFHEDVAALGCLPPTVEPRATEHIEAMKELIERLVTAGCAYVAEDHVLFNVASMPDYGKLSRRSLDEMIAGARVEVAPYKREPTDFVLWKPSKPGEPAWPSPAGIKAPGRPGWHVECSAMADYWLWEKAKPNLTPSGLAHPHQFDIHGGGIDLVFPHHENERAQSRCAFHTKVMANYWVHNGFLQVEGEKMSKSLGNFVTIRELLTEWKGVRWYGDDIRLAMLTAHYAQPIDWTDNRLAEAGANLHTFHLMGVRGLGLTNEADLKSIAEIATGRPSAALLESLCDDLNTPQAIYSHFFGLVKRANTEPSALESLAKQLLIDCLFLGVDPFRFYRQSMSSIDIDKVEKLISARTAARAAKNFKESDCIRDELAAMGVVLKDTKDGTTWEIA